MRRKICYNRSMKKTIAKILFPLASFVLLFCLVFSAVQLVVADDSFLETQHKKLGTNVEMGMSVGDLAKSTKVLLDYMRGRADSIYVEVTVQGEVMEMFVLPIEVIHMAEVQQVWSFFVVARNFGLLFALALYAIAAMLYGEDPLTGWSRGYLYALGAFGLLAAFFVLWASGSFSAFWLEFHKVIFPGSENWMLPYESRMVQMLTEQFFANVIIRIVLVALAGIGALLLFAVGTLLIARWKRARYEAIAEPSGWISEPEPEGPDLIIAHRLRNVSIRQRQQIEREVAEEARIREEMETFGDTVQVFAPEDKTPEEE